MKTIFGIALALAALPLRAQTPNALVDQLLDRIVARERSFLESIQKRTPLIETYIQETSDSAQASERTTRDHYFLGRYRLGATVSYQPLIEHTDAQPPKSASRMSFRAISVKSRPLVFLPRGFAQMAVIDLEDFNRQTYHFEYVHREFLGEVRCLVFDVTPVNRQQPGKFLGRIWVEDRDNSIVRFNGTYAAAPTPKGALPELYFHFDSWRVNTGGSDWVPAEIYVEEEGTPDKNAAIAAPRERCARGGQAPVFADQFSEPLVPAVAWIDVEDHQARGHPSTDVRVRVAGPPVADPLGIVGRVEDAVPVAATPALALTGEWVAFRVRGRNRRDLAGEREHLVAGDAVRGRGGLEVRLHRACRPRWCTCTGPTLHREACRTDPAGSGRARRVHPRSDTRRDRRAATGPLLR
jgi:hypothetical protein